MKDLERIEARAQAARFILENPLVEELFEDMERSYFSVWQRTGPKDTEKRETVWLLLSGLHAFKKELTNLIVKGTVAGDSLEREARGGISVGTDLPARGPLWSVGDFRP